MTSNEHLRADSLFGLNGKVALVTGGGTGIGLMIAKGLAVNGAITYIGSRRREVIERAAAEFNAQGGAGGKLVPVELDVTSKESIHKAVELIGSTHGKLDILVNNAGQVGPTASFFGDPSSPHRLNSETLGTALFNNESFEDWSDLFRINLTSIYFVTIAFLGLLDKASQESGPFTASVVNITSISGSTKLAQNHFAYNTSKAAGDRLTQILATEFALKDVKVRVNAIAPGLFPSEMVEREGGEFGAEETTRRSRALVPVPGGRSGKAEEIAGSALYLVSKAGGYTNGQILVVDGSWLAVNPSTR